jgi:hypothetical protein
LKKWSREVATLRQNWLQSESNFLSFAQERGFSVKGVVYGQPGEFHRRQWLSADERRGSDLYFHPFRIHPLHQILSSHKPPTPAEVGPWNETADLAILMEPVYWPMLTGHVRQSLPVRDDEKRRKTYQRKIIKLLRGLDPDVWRKRHDNLRIDAGWMDKNAELYLLLRVSSWKQREQLLGRIGGALWLRHMAEVLRRGFEEAFDAHWLEEDRAFGHWPAGARKHAFGSERPLDDIMHSKPYLADRFELFTGSVLRWYVEGQTEYYAILYILPEPHRMGIELVNLYSQIESGKGNAARKLEDALKEDLSLRRFSAITFDLDVLANVKAVRRQIQQDHIVGSINANAPDFEFANFSLTELVEIAAKMDDGLGFEGDKLRKADWAGVKKGRQFEERYSKTSERKTSLKGKDWGEALAQYALQNRRNPVTNAERPFLQQIWPALRALGSNYDFHKATYTFDLQSFQPKHR